MSEPSPPAVEVLDDGDGRVVVRVDGVVRATFAGDLDDPDDRAALDELVSELFGPRHGTSN